MKFNHDYLTDFFDINGPQTPQHKRAVVRFDFIQNLADYLVWNHTKRSTAAAIAEAVYVRMTDDRLHYHTPVHVLCMFQYAEFYGIKLTPTDELAIWFHDSVYVPGAPLGQNEYDSQVFMRAMLGHADTRNMQKEAAEIITATAYHEKEEHPQNCWTVLDLDLVHFAVCNKKADECIKAELVPVYGDLFYKGRPQFLKHLIAKGFLYRTYNHNEAALSVIQAEIDRAEDQREV